MFVSQQGYPSRRKVLGISRDKRAIITVEGKLRSPLLFNLMFIRETTLSYVSEGSGGSAEGDGTN